MSCSIYSKILLEHWLGRRNTTRPYKRIKKIYYFGLKREHDSIRNRLHQRVATLLSVERK